VERGFETRVIEEWSKRYHHRDAEFTEFGVFFHQELSPLPLSVSAVRFLLDRYNREQLKRK
jgi:hypothetical protein